MKLNMYVITMVGGKFYKAKKYTISPTKPETTMSLPLSTTKDHVAILLLCLL